MVWSPFPRFNFNQLKAFASLIRSSSLLENKRKSILAQALEAEGFEVVADGRTALEEGGH